MYYVPMSKIVPKEVIGIAKKLQENGFSTYICWGWCRDYFFDMLSNDIDLFTDALPDEVKSILHIVWEVGKKYGTMIVQEWKKTYEITTFRRDIGTINNRKPAKVEFTKSLFEDAQRRDFTCNAIYYDILEEKFIDPTWWILDIQNKKIRFVWDIEHRLQEDVLRILRYIRLKNKYGFQDAETSYQKIFKKYTPLLVNISKERIKDEIEKIFLIFSTFPPKKIEWHDDEKLNHKNLNFANIQAIKQLQKIWFFELFFPEIEKLLDTPGWAPWHREWNVWTHTLMTLQELSNIFLQSSKNIPKAVQIDLFWTLLLHDTWKFPCLSFDTNKRVHYYWHEQVSAQIFEKYKKTWSFSNKSFTMIYWLIENHLRISKCFEMSPTKRHIFMTHKYFWELLYILEADKKWRFPSSSDWVQDLRDYFKKFQKKLQTVKFFTGKDVMLKYPDISPVKIWEVLEQWNSDILKNIKIS